MIAGEQQRARARVCYTLGYIRRQLASLIYTCNEVQLLLIYFTLS